MARSLFIISFLLLVNACTAHARVGSQMYKSGIPTEIKELLEPVLSSDASCGKNVVYHDIKVHAYVNYKNCYEHKRADAEGTKAYEESHGKNGVYHDPSATSYYHDHKRVDAEGTKASQLFKSNLSYFLEKDLFSGNPLKAIFYRAGIVPECAYLPRAAADSIPFSSAHIDQILSRFSIDPVSADAATVKETLEFCDLSGKEDICTTSLEDMEELAVAKLGKGAKPLTTKMEADPTEKRTYQVKRAELKGKNYMSCHRLSYLYAVHYCHKVPATVVYEVSLLRDDGVAGEALALCHRDNSGWDANYFAFKSLHVQPGKESVCHFFPKGHLLWIATK